MKSFHRIKEFKGRDGELYKFATLPMTRKTFGIINKIDETKGDGLDGAMALIEAFELSLSKSYDAETVEQLLENEVLPIRSSNEEEKETMAAIAKWIFSGQ